MHMGYKLSPTAVAGLVRNALGLSYLFFFVWWQDRRSEDLELLVVLANILGLLVAGPPLGSRSVYLRVCRHGERQRYSLCSRPEAKACSHTCCGLKPCVVANHSSKHSFTSKTGCESMFLYMFTHMWFEAVCSSKQLYIYIYTHLHSALGPFLGVTPS